MKGYELIYPCADPAKTELFDNMLKKANEIWDEFTTGKNRGKKKEVCKPTPV